SVLPTWATPPTPWPCAAKPVWRDDPWPNLGSARAPEGRLDGGRRIGARRPGGVAPAVRGRAGLAIRPVGHSRRAVPRPHGRTPRQYSDPGVRRHGLAALIGLAVAWCVERSDLPGRHWWRVAAGLPLAVPAFVSSYAWSSLGLAFQNLG